MLSIMFWYVSKISFNLFQNFDCLTDGPPELMSRVEVRWTDGNLYPGKFVGTNAQEMYIVSTVTS